MNNPLKYSDPSGDLFGIDDAMLAFIILSNAMMEGEQSQMNGGNFWTGAARGAVVGAASVIIPYGIGEVFGHAVGGIGTELLRAGAHGLGDGLLNVMQGGSFASGFATGAVASFAGSYGQWAGAGSYGVIGACTAAGAGVSALSGGNWMTGAMQGMDIGVYNHEGWIDDAYSQQGKTYELNDVVCTAKKINKSFCLIARMIYYARMVNNYRSHGKLTLYNKSGNIISIYDASSGSGSGKVARTLPAGNYTASGFSLTNDPRFMKYDIGFKINLNPAKVWDESLDRFRSALEIHPAYLGTLGCIGLNETEENLIDFQNKWLNTIRVNKVVPVNVMYH